jgi:hypothetical protein
MTHTRSLILAALVAASALAPMAACSSSDDSSSGSESNLGSSGNGTGGGSAASGGAGSGVDGGSSAAGGTTAVGGGASAVAGAGGLASLATALCGTSTCLCADGIDNDGDGLVDGFDPECTGPLDNDEGTFATGISGDNKDPKWQDCFFDGNSGAGDDDCRYSTDCLTGDLPADDPDCVVSDQCVDFCSARTPNGCDCFGCCQVTDSSGNDVFVYLDATCSTDNLDDTNACPRCEQSTQCGNQCGECELCLGRTEADLPDSCFPAAPPDAGTGGTSSVTPPAYTCDNGEQVCSLELPCPTNEYCQQGCCLTILR